MIMLFHFPTIKKWKTVTKNIALSIFYSLKSYWGGGGGGGIMYSTKKAALSSQKYI